MSPSDDEGEARRGEGEVTEKTPFNTDFPSPNKSAIGINNDDDPVDIGVAIQGGGCGFGSILYCSGAFLLQGAYGAEVIVLTIVGLIVKCEWDLTTFWVSVLQMSSVLTEAVAALLTSTWGDQYGRRTICLYSSVGLVLAGGLCATARNFWQLVMWRAICGVFMGTGMGPAVALTGEIPPIRFRSIGISAVSLSWGFGAAMASGVAYLTIGTLGWRWYLFVVAACFAPSIFLFWVIYESPRQDVRKGRIKKAEKTIKNIYMLNCRSSDGLALLEDETDGTAKEEDVEEVSSGVGRLVRWLGYGKVYRELQETNNISTILLVAGLTASSQFTYYALAYAVPRFLNEGYCTGRDLTPEQSCTFSDATLLELGLVSLFEPIGVLIAVFAVDIIGRRPTFFVDTLCSLALLTCIYFCAARWFLTAPIFLLKGTVAILTWAPFLLASELFPTGLRSFATSICNSVQGFVAIVAIMVVQLSFEVSPRLVLGMLQGVIFLGGVCLFYLKKETMGAQLEQ